MASNDQNNSKSHSSNQQNQIVVVIVPFPAQGHLNQLLHLSRLILSHNIPVHYVGTSTHNRQATVRVQGWDPNSISNIHFHNFKVPPYVSPPPAPNSETKFPAHLVPSFEASTHLRQPVAELMQSLSSVFKRVVVIHDSLMASVVQDARNIANVENYLFMSTCAFTYFTSLSDKLGNIIPIESPHIIDTPSMMEGCFTAEIIDFITRQNEFYELNDGTIFNTSRAIESPYFELIEKIICNKKHWALGPFNPLTIEKNDSKGRHSCTGFVVRDWAPQLEILSHPSTGGFMSHCGWNSTLESLSMGVPIAAWPMHSDQPKNSVLITQVLKVGLLVRDWSKRDELVAASDIENAVRTLMDTKEGDEMRERAVSLKNAIRISTEEVGVSRLEMDSFISHITR
ncbi:zeatin O-glucosyltransferase [Trifolium repens]|nr:zeatin O-glucosyltransferase [Trifolium repens]